MPVIRKFLDLSTSHLDDESRRMLDAAAADTLSIMGRDKCLPPGVDVSVCRNDPLSAAGQLVIYPTAYGWFGYAHDDFDALKEAGVSDVLVNIYRYARQNGCDYVMFDCDAGEDENLPTFEWFDAA
jgi:hypothetical protein